MVGAEVTVGEIGERYFVTDANGEIVRSLDDNFQIAAVIVVEVAGVVRVTTGPRLLKSGNTVVVDIAATE